jgi:CrcB protein
MKILAVAIGGAIGAVCRFLISNFFQKSPDDRFPFGTFIINMSGSLLLGGLFGSSIGSIWMLLLATGFCGAFTTFSTLQWEILQFKHTKQTRTMVWYVVLTYFCGISLAIFGYWIGKMCMV